MRELGEPPPMQIFESPFLRLSDSPLSTRPPLQFKVSASVATVVLRMYLDTSTAICTRSWTRSTSRLPRLASTYPSTHGTWLLVLALLPFKSVLNRPTPTQNALHSRLLRFRSFLLAYTTAPCVSGPHLIVANWFSHLEFLLAVWLGWIRQEGAFDSLKMDESRMCLPSSRTYELFFQYLTGTCE